MTKTDRSMRTRVPAPLLKHPLPSGRGATEQPNVTSGEHAALTPVFWLLVIATGVAAGLLGDAMTGAAMQARWPDWPS